EARTPGDRLVDRVRCGHEPERPVAGRRALGRDEQVRPHTPWLDPEPTAPPADPGHDLVRDEQDAVAAADLGDLRPVVVRWDRRGQGRPDDRPGPGRRARPGTGRQDGRLEFLGQLVASRERVRAWVAGTIRI